MDYEGTAVNYIAGTPYLGASVRMYPGPGGYQGELIAWDVANAKKVWSIKEPDLPVYSGVLATGGRRGLLRHHGRLVPSRRCSQRQSSLADETRFGDYRKSR